MTDFKQKDELYEIFIRNLESPSQPQERAEDLIYNVVVEYMLSLMEQGNVPHRFLDHLENDLKEEVQEIYLKTTYGYSSLESYRVAKKIIKKAG